MNVEDLALFQAVEVLQTFERMLQKLKIQKQQVANINSWLRPELEVGFQLPRKATTEHKGLSMLSRTPWLKLVVDNVTQAMFVDNIYSSKGPTSELWRIWRANKLHSRQIANHRCFIAYGHSYALVTHNYYDNEIPLVRLLSPCTMAVEYGDTGSFDHRPAAALYEYSNGGRIYWSLFFPGVRYDIGENPNPGTITRDETGFSSEYAILNCEELDVDYVPVVRFANQEDLDGNVIGEVEPFIPTAQRINKTTYDRLLAQHFNSWKVKTVTGLDLPVLKDQDGDPTDQPDEAATDHLKIKLAQEDMLVSDDPETRFGVLDATALEPFVESFKSDIEALAAVSQTPAHALTGQMSNLTPEALAAARGPLMQKVSERKANASASYDTLLQIIADHAGLAELADDPMLRVTWQDTEIRSMSQAVDALGKAAQMLGVPKRALWPLIPNIERSTIEEWERLADEELKSDPMNALFQRQTARNEDEVTGG